MYETKAAPQYELNASRGAPGPMKGITTCPVCGGNSFAARPILWKELIAEWGLAPHEAEYINRQQGYCCTVCGNCLRALALASAILQAYSFHGTFVQFVQTARAQQLRVLEINEAGGLSPILSHLPQHTLVRYPEYDMTNLAFASNSYDLVLHSDTLEHVPNPVAGLSECLRVLERSGRCIFTVPVVVGRMSKSRVGMKDSYHGTPSTSNSGYIVRTEFGADVWRYPLAAGFANVRIHTLEYPAALAIEAIKDHGPEGKT